MVNNHEKFSKIIFNKLFFMKPMGLKHIKKEPSKHNLK